MLEKKNGGGGHGRGHFCLRVWHPRVNSWPLLLVAPHLGRTMLVSRAELMYVRKPVGPKRGRKCYITPAFSGIPKQRGAKSELAASALPYGGPKVGGNATSPLHSRGSPTKGTKSKHQKKTTEKPKKIHLEERLLDQAQARASYTPLFWGHSRSIPQGMILDVQPLVKSLFCPIRQSPNGFFDSEASIP